MIIQFCNHGTRICIIQDDKKASAEIPIPDLKIVSYQRCVSFSNSRLMYGDSYLC